MYLKPEVLKWTKNTQLFYYAWRIVLNNTVSFPLIYKNSCRMMVCGRLWYIKSIHYTKRRRDIWTAPTTLLHTIIDNDI